MKVVRKILYVIAGLIVLFTVLIIASAYNPNITKGIQKVLFKGRNVVISDNSIESEEDMSEDGDNPNDGTSEDSKDNLDEIHELRSLEELGIDESEVIDNIEAYYSNCHNQILEKGIGEYSFENIIDNEALIQEIYARYSDKGYIDGYMNDTLNELGAIDYEMNLLVEELENKRFRLTHQIKMN